MLAEIVSDGTPYYNIGYFSLRLSCGCCLIGALTIFKPFFSWLLIDYYNIHNLNIINCIFTENMKEEQYKEGDELRSWVEFVGKQVCIIINNYLVRFSHFKGGICHTLP